MLSSIPKKRTQASLTKVPISGVAGLLEQLLKFEASERECVQMIFSNGYREAMVFRKNVEKAKSNFKNECRAVLKEMHGIDVDL